MIKLKVEVTKNIMGLDEQITNIIEQLNDIYFGCRKQSKILNKKIETRKTSAHIAMTNRDIYSKELKELLEEIIILTEEKNNCEYDKIVRFIDNIVYNNQKEEPVVNEVVEKDKSFVLNTKFSLIKQRLMNKKMETENTIFSFMNKVEQNSNLLLTNVNNAFLNKISYKRKRMLVKYYNS